MESLESGFIRVDDFRRHGQTANQYNHGNLNKTGKWSSSGTSGSGRTDQTHELRTMDVERVANAVS